MFETKSRKSSRPEVLCKKDVLRNFSKFTEKHLFQSLLFNKVAGQPRTLLKKRLWHRCFPVNFAKFSKTAFLTEHLRWLLLNLVWPGSELLVRPVVTLTFLSYFRFWYESFFFFFWLPVGKVPINSWLFVRQSAHPYIFTSVHACNHFFSESLSKFFWNFAQFGTICTI